MHTTELANKKLLISFKKKRFKNVHRLISLVKERLYTQRKNTLNIRTQRNRGVKKFL